MSKVTELASSQITATETITVEPDFYQLRGPRC